MNKYIVEFIGTFFLVFTIGMAVIGGAGSFAPIAIGAMLMVMIYAGGHISGAHYNPAVTLAVFMRGKCDAKDVPMYIAAQLAAAAAAAIMTSVVVSGLNVVNPSPAEIAIVPALLAELLGTFALCWVVLHTATTATTANNSYYGLAIGFTVTACAYALGAVSGGAFNPAVALGISIMELSSWANIWIFLVANFAAGALAAIVFKMVYKGE